MTSPRVIVTGSARGIGAAIAERFAGEGWHPLLVDVNPDVVATADSIERAHGVACDAMVVDITDRSGRDAICAAAAEHGGVRALVNNAGITADALLHKMTAEQFGRVVRINLGAAVQLSSSIAPLLDEQGGIINVSSKSASGNVGQFNYAVSKAGLVGATRSLALQLAPRVRVNAVAPAFIATEMTAAIPDHLRQRFVSRIPFGRAGDPGEVADVVLWLASPESSYVTGQLIAICGGRSFAP